MIVSVRAFGAMEIVGSGGVPGAWRLTSRRRRVLLGLLLVRRGGVVSRDTLVEAMWPAASPAAPGKSLQIQVHRLRRLLEGVAAVKFVPPGYALSIADERVDLYEFEGLLRQAGTVRRAGTPAEAGDLLRRALALYRGPAFYGLDDVDDLAVESHRLAEVRLGALADRIDAELAVGRHTELVAELRALVAEHPLRERFRAQLMTALRRCGLPGEALAVYRAGEALTRRELGVELGEQCRALARAIRDGTAEPAEVSAPVPRVQVSAPEPAGRVQPAPRQLPPDIRGFIGRVEALRRLDGLLADLDAPAPVVVVVDGMGGVGKTALAARWGHQVVGRFPDGQLYLDLRGHAATGPLRPWEAARRLLVALGDDPEEVPTSTDDAAARLRSMLAGRRVLLVLDDAVSVDQVRPLLPGTGGCLVLVTSRQRLTGLVVREGARQLPLDPLSETESVALLASLVGSGRVAAEPAAVAELARLCGHLPLPLRVVGAGLAGAPSQRLQDWVDLLRSGDRLRLLDVPGDRDASVEAALEASYLRLPVDAARMLRLVGLVPVESVAAPAAAALAGVALPRASHLLGNLVEARLLEEQAGRYTCRALVRAYAEQRGQHDEPPAGRAEALSRFYDFYCGTAEVVAALFYPAEQRPPATSLTAVASTAGAIRFTAPAQALGWIEDELGAVTSIVRHTAAHGPYQVAWRLADAIRGFLHHGARLAEADAIGRAAVEAAGAMGDPAARGAALVNLAGVRFQQGRYREAEAYGTRALRLLRGSGWDTREALARSLLGMASSDQGRVEEAVRHFLAALSRYERIGWPYGQAQAVGNLAVCVFELGRLREAADYAGRAAAVFADLGSAVNEAHGLANLGRTCYHLGQLEEAERHLTRAGQRYREAGDDAEQADPIAAMALVDSAAGRLAAARESAEAALVIVGRAGNARHEPDCWMALGTVHERSGDRGRAWSCFQRAMTAASATGERYAQAAALIGLAGACPPSETGAARAHLDAALAIIRRVGYRLLEGAALTGLAEVDLAEGAAAAAVARAQRALAVHRATGYRLGEADTHSLLYRALTATGRPIAAREHQRRADDLVVGWRVRSGDARTGTGTATAPTPVAS